MFDMSLLHPGNLIQYAGRNDFIKKHPLKTPDWDPLYYVYKVVEFDPDKEIVYLLELFGTKSTIGVPLSEVTKEVDPELFPSANQVYQYDSFRVLDRD